jgi:hypothetical protein
MALFILSIYIIKAHHCQTQTPLVAGLVVNLIVKVILLFLHVLAYRYLYLLM